MFHGSDASLRRGAKVNKAGVFLLIVGLILSVYTGFSYVTRERLVDFQDVGGSQVSQDSVYWQPYVGIGVMIVGGLFLRLNRKQALAN